MQNALGALQAFGYRRPQGKESRFGSMPSGVGIGKGERGNKPYPLETMLRLYLLQNLYDLSDEATVAEVIDSRAFSDFCGIDSSNQVPDGDTLGRFRNLLLKNGLQEKLFSQKLKIHVKVKLYGG